MKRAFCRLITKILQPKVNLIDAIIHGKKEDVKLAISQRADMNFMKLYDKNAFVYPLLTAVYFERLDLVKLMLEKGSANPNIGINSFPFFIFSDPNLHFSPEPRVCPLLFFNVFDWTCITPTVLAFVKGNVRILTECLARGGNVSSFFRGGRSFLKFFLENDNSRSIRMCMLLCKYHQFSLTDSEQNVFVTEFLRYEDGEVGDKSPSYEKGVIFEILEKFGFAIPNSEEKELLVGYESSSYESSSEGQPEFIRRYFRYSTVNNREEKHQEGVDEVIIKRNDRENVFKILSSIKKKGSPTSHIPDYLSKQSFDRVNVETPLGDGIGSFETPKGNNNSNGSMCRERVIRRSILRRTRSIGNKLKGDDDVMKQEEFFSWTSHSDTEN